MKTGPGTLTDDIWWASRSPDENKLRYMGAGDPKKYQMFSSLLSRGFLLNGPVVFQGWGPAYQQNELTLAGDVWFPAAGHEQLVATGQISKQGPMPWWGIAVSTDAADYPKWGTTTASISAGAGV